MQMLSLLLFEGTFARVLVGCGNANEAEKDWKELADRRPQLTSDCKHSLASGGSFPLPLTYRRR